MSSSRPPYYSRRRSSRGSGSSNGDNVLASTSARHTASFSSHRNLTSSVAAADAASSSPAPAFRFSFKFGTTQRNFRLFNESLVESCRAANYHTVAETLINITVPRLRKDAISDLTSQIQEKQDFILSLEQRIAHLISISKWNTTSTAITKNRSAYTDHTAHFLVQLRSQLPESEHNQLDYLWEEFIVNFPHQKIQLALWQESSTFSRPSRFSFASFRRIST